jgi:hypothetical protein
VDNLSLAPKIPEKVLHYQTRGLDASLLDTTLFDCYWVYFYWFKWPELSTSLAGCVTTTFTFYNRMFELMLTTDHSYVIPATMFLLMRNVLNIPLFIVRFYTGCACCIFIDRSQVSTEKQNNVFELKTSVKTTVH